MFLPSISLAQAVDYLPLSKQEIGEMFPLDKEKTIDSANPVSFSLSAGPAGMHFDSHVGSQSNLIAYGQDKKGKDWRVVISEVFGAFVPVDFYKADLDKNGFVDIVIMMPTGGNGFAPSVHLIAIMFDVYGRPIPFEADGYFQSLEHGVDFIVDMNGDGKAELIYMNFNDGYWITNVYTCENARWSQIKGAYGKRQYPLFTRFTNRPNRKAVIPAQGRHPFSPNLSNDQPVLEGFLTSFHIPEEYSEIEMTFEDSKGDHFICTPAYWYDSARVVLDTPESRQIAHLSLDDKENADKILKQIIEENVKVKLYGQRYPDKCSPETTWATKSK